MSSLSLITLVVCALVATSYAQLPKNELHLLLQKMAGPHSPASSKLQSPAPSPSPSSSSRLAFARSRLGLANPYKSTRPLPRPSPSSQPTEPSPNRYVTRDQVKKLQEQAKKAMEAARAQSEKAERLNREAQLALQGISSRRSSISPAPTNPTPTLEALLPPSSSFRRYSKYSLPKSRSYSLPKSRSYSLPKSRSYSLPKSRSLSRTKSFYSRQNMISPANRVRASQGVPGVSENSLAAKVMKLRAERMKMQAGKSRKATPLAHAQALAIRRAQAAGLNAAQKTKVEALTNPYAVPKEPTASVPTPKSSPVPTSNPYSQSRAASSDVAAVRDTAQQAMDQQNKAIEQRRMLIQRRRMALMNMAKKAKAKIHAFKTIKKIQDQPKKDKEAMQVGCMPHPMLIPMGSCKDLEVRFACARHRFTKSTRPSCVDIGIKPMCCPRGVTVKSIQNLNKFKSMQKNMKHYQRMFEMMN